jgi:prepilin-type N-terminal cleavage/methylation domain-containing protein
MNFTKQRGFTIIEVVIALSLIAVFITLPVFAYSSYLQKARDIQRKNDIQQLESALVQYKTQKGEYPASLDMLVAAQYIPSIPFDPLFSALNIESDVYGYRYEVRSDLQAFTLIAALEERTSGGEIQYVVATSAGISVPVGTPTPTSPLTPTAAIITNTPVPTITPSETPSPTPEE